MMYCPNCNKELEDGALFCDGCGAQITVEEAAPEVETVFCPQCGEQTDASAPYCQNCGAPVGEEAPAPAKKALPKKALLFGGIAVAVIALVVILIAAFSGGRNNKYVAYTKDGELFFSNFSKDSVEVTSKLLDSEYLSKSDLADASEFSHLVQMSADGKTMFFPDKIDGKGGYTIYYRNVTKADSEAVKVSGDVDYYSINEDGSKIFYSKDGTLYMGSVDEPEKVASDFDAIAVNTKFDTLIIREREEVTVKEDGYEYQDYEYTYYLWKNGEKEKIVGGKISGFRIMNETGDYGYKKLTKVCYLKDDVLYVQTIGKEAEKIDSDVTSIVMVYESGDIYYKKSGDELKYVDFINNDNNTEFTDEEKKETFGQTTDLYCYSDGESVLIVENYNYGYFASEKAVAIISTTNVNDIKKVKMSEYSNEYYSSFWSATSEVMNRYYELDSTISVLAGGALTEIDLDDINDYEMTDDGSQIYFFCVGYKEEKDEEGNVISRERKEKGEIYLATVKKSTVNAPEEFDSDVAADLGISLNRNDELVYYKEYKADKNKATLVIDQEEIDSDVLPGSVSTLKNGAYVYYVDYNSDSDKQCGTLKISKKGNATVIAEDVHDYVVTPDSEVLYLYEYNVEKYRGELYRYNNGKNNFIDEDVISILDIYKWLED